MNPILTGLMLLGLLVLPAPSVVAEPAPPVAAPAIPPPQWQQLFPATNPTSLTEVALAYDTTRGKALMFGGYTGNGDAVDETWQWDSQSMNWTLLQPISRPAPRLGAAMAYHAARDEFVLFGGEDDLSVDLGDTWIYSPSTATWAQVLPTTSPTPRWLHGMVYDSQRQVVVLFGGCCIASQETWEWDPDANTWELQTIAAPARRFGMGLTYDSRRGVTVLFGGDDGFGSSYYQDTWERAGSGDWVKIIPSRKPEGRQRMKLAYFPRARRTILYGGLNYWGMRLADTWAWDGLNWQKANLNPHPTGSSGGMVYDSVLDGMLLYVSISPIGERISETWLLR